MQPPHQPVSIVLIEKERRFEVIRKQRAQLLNELVEKETKQKR